MVRSRRRSVAVVTGLAIAAIGILSGGPRAAHAQSKDVVIFAAASLKNALDDAAALYKEKTGKVVTVNYAASSALAKQIEEAAPADIFFSADLAWMDYLQEKNLIKHDSRVTLLGNTIVLVAPADSSVALTLEPGAKLADALGADGKLAMANVDSVPAGKYGKAALEKLGVWQSVSGKIAHAENGRAALLLVSRGEAPAGIVYQTDAAADANVKIIGTFPEDSHPPIIYPVALTANASHPDATAFLAYIRSVKAKPVFEAQGFTVLSRGQS